MVETFAKEVTLFPIPEDSNADDDDDDGDDNFEDEVKALLESLCCDDELFKSWFTVEDKLSRESFMLATEDDVKLCVKLCRLKSQLRRKTFPQALQL